MLEVLNRAREDSLPDLNATRVTLTVSFKPHIVEQANEAPAFGSLIASLPQPALEICSLTGKAAVNCAWAKAAQSENVLAASGEWHLAIHTEDRSRARWQLDAAMQAGRALTLEARLQDHRTGDPRWHVLSATPVPNDLGPASSWCLIATDIHDLRTPAHAFHEHSSQNAARETSLRMLGTTVLDAISADQPLGRILELIANAVDAIIPGVRSSILLIEDGKLLAGVAPSFPADYLRSVHGVPIKDGAGSCGTAAVRGTQVITTDIATDPLWQGLTDLVDQMGLVACWSTPVCDAEGKVLATFGVYPSTSRAPDPAELALIEEIGKYVRIAIERTRQTEELRRSEGRYRSLHDMVPVLIWEEDWCDVIPALRALQAGGITDFVGHFDANPDELTSIIKSVRVLGVNETGARMFGAASGEELMAAFDDLVDSSGARRVFKKSLAAWAAGEREMEAESVNFDLNGRALHLLVKVALPDPNSSDTRVVLSEMDMTALRIADERFRIIAQATSDVVLDRDLIADATWCSDGMADRFGHDPDILSRDAKALLRLIHAEDRDRVATSLDAALSGDIDRWSAQFRMLRADGSYAQVRERSIILRDDAGRALRVIGSLVDITDQLRLEEQLRQSQRLDAVGQLTGGVAHDFNNLLTVILGNAEILSESLNDPRLQTLAEMCSAAALRGAELTSRLLAFARKQSLDPKRFDVNELVHGLESLLRRALGEQIEIQLALADGVAPAIADATQLESAILNLCLNSRDAMPQGGRLLIETANVEISPDAMGPNPELLAGSYVVISVSDTGSGMDTETLTRAVEPFFTTKEVGKGSGLGLSMVYGFAKQSHGHVDIVSTPGAGTTVRLYLPRPADATATDDSQCAAPEAPTGTETILLVEDDDMVREHVEIQLQSLGYTVVSVTTGAEALMAITAHHRVDLLFTDVVMPGGVSGPDLAERVRDRLPDLPILFTSGYSEDHIGRNRPLQPGQELLRKPYRRHELANAIRAVLDEAASPPREDSLPA